MTFKLEWGGQPPEGYTGPAWGARAIYSLRITGRSVIDLVWDRQSVMGDPGEVRALCDMLDTRGLDTLREACTSERLRTDEHRVVRVDVGDYVIEANPRESCGYLYIVAYRRPCLACKRGVPESRVYSGAVGPFCDVSCRERYLSRPPPSATDTLESYLPPLRKRLPATEEPGYDGDEMAARARSASLQLREHVKPVDLGGRALVGISQPIPFEPATRVSGTLGTYKCNVPMCGESGVCAECRKRGAH